MASLINFKSIKKPFEQVYEENYDRVYTYVYSIVMHRETAEDVTAEAFIAALENYDRYDPEIASVFTWLSRIARNKAFNHIAAAEQKHRAEMPEDADEFLGSGSGFMTSDEDRSIESLMDERAEIERLFKRLTAEERDFLTLRYTMELKDAEVAELMGMNTKAVNKRYQRLLAKCLDILNG